MKTKMTVLLVGEGCAKFLYALLLAILFLLSVENYPFSFEPFGRQLISLIAVFRFGNDEPLYEGEVLADAWRPCR